MTCPPLASTGVPVLEVLTISAALLVAGTVLLLLSRRGRSRAMPASLVLLALTGALCTGATFTEAHASSPDCLAGAAPATAQLAIVQTSVMSGLAPGVAPERITGTITNTGSASTFVAAVTVTITSMTGPPAGMCTPADYVLVDTVMPVGRTLAAGASADFAGARIGFRDCSVNQDACKGAVVNLHYLSS